MYCRNVFQLLSWVLRFHRKCLTDAAEYTACRNEMLTGMTNMAKVVEKRLKSDGYKTKVISASGGKWVECGGRKEQFGYISLKHAAEIAGLGVIGKIICLTNSPVWQPSVAQRSSYQCRTDAG